MAAAVTTVYVCPFYCVGFYFVLYSSIFISCCSGHSSYRFFSTKTPYEWVHKSKSLTTVDEWYYLPELKGSSCSAVHANAVLRHGARFPGLDDVHEISNIHEKLLVSLEPDVNPNLYNWINKFPSNNNKALSHLGEEEQEALGKRIAQKLTSLLADEDLSSFRFIVSSQERTKQSASSFYEGLTNVLNKEEDIEDEFDSEVNDELLRFFNLCEKYVFAVEKNKTAHKEYYSFLQSDQVNEIRNKIHKKLNMKDDVLTTGNVRLIYLMCGYEMAAFKESPWCSLLDESDMEILEYLGDLKHYFKNGYGYNITCQQSCPLVSEIFLTMDEVINDIENSDSEDEQDEYIVGQFAFGHAETLGPLYCALGLFKDQEGLRADNFDKRPDHKFRTSEILPFSANIVFVLYECVPEELGEDEEIEEADYYLKMFINEKPHVIPGCEKLYCPYKQVRQYYRKLVDECDFKGICKRSAERDEL